MADVNMTLAGGALVSTCIVALPSPDSSISITVVFAKFKLAKIVTV